MKKTFRALCLFLAFSFVLTTAVFADEATYSSEQSMNYSTTLNSNGHMTYTIMRTQSQIESELNDAAAQVEKEIIIQRGPTYEYKSTRLSPKYKTVKGYAGNQVRDGYRFQTGGGFWFEDSGGPSVSASITISAPSPFDVLGFSISLGQKGTSGLWVEAPNKTDYFKLYIEKKVKITPVLTYERKKGTNDEWKLISSTGVPQTVSVNAYAKRV